MGIFSTSVDPLNEMMWAHYSDNGKGICIGFDTVELIRDLGVGFGLAIYQDEPLFYSFILGKPITSSDDFLYKHSKWRYEKEFRLIAFFIKKEEDRKVSIPSKSVTNIILGINATDETKSEIIDILKTKYNSGVKLFQAETSISLFGLTLNELEY